MSTQQPGQNDQLARRKNPTLLITCLLLIAVGIALFFLSRSMADKTSTLYMLCSTSGLIMAATGLLLVLFGGKQTIYLPTKSPVKSKTVNVEGLGADALTAMLEEKRYAQIAQLPRVENGPVRLALQFSEDGAYLALQVWHYVPHTYEPASGLHVVEAHLTPEVQLLFS